MRCTERVSGSRGSDCIRTFAFVAIAAAATAAPHGAARFRSLRSCYTIHDPAQEARGDALFFVGDDCFGLLMGARQDRCAAAFEACWPLHLCLSYRSDAEGLLSSHSRGSVISTEAQRSGETCCLPRALRPSREQQLLRDNRPSLRSQECLLGPDNSRSLRYAAG